MAEKITEQDLDKIRQWFGVDLDSLTEESFAASQKAARKKFHPDNFAHLGDDGVMEMAKERFQELEKLAAKIRQHFEAKAAPAEKDPYLYASDGMSIDIMTQDKTLKFQLFSSAMIYEGDKVNIPGTAAKLISRDDYLPRISTGFRDNIKVHLAFGPQDDLRAVVFWLFQHINGRTSTFVIEGKVVPIQPEAILHAIRKEARKELGPGQAD
ncbi:MAG: hypothetical protein NWR72_14075 [Bacteroidia bacterium]|nr:hypothetical protein [Bacteroidia bacterium]